jgi:hypothetical protein
VTPRKQGNRKRLVENDLALAASIGQGAGLPDEVIGLMLNTPVSITIEGGCDECDAYQRIRRERLGFWRDTIYHDDDCPRLARINAKAAT